MKNVLIQFMPLELLCKACQFRPWRW